MTDPLVRQIWRSMSFFLQGIMLLLTIVLLPLSTLGSSDADIAWQTIQQGMDYARIDLIAKAEYGDNRLHCVRIDPGISRLTAVLASQNGGKRNTAGGWCREKRLAAAINLGMFQMDKQTNVGYARNGLHINNGRWHHSYQSALAFGPRKSKTPPAVMMDLEEANSRQRLSDYDTVVQNLRLIKGSGKNVWEIQEKRWSETAIAVNSIDHIMFLFSRSPFSMHEFNRIIVGLPLGVTRAMHVEGGPEASLSIHAGGVDLDLCGSFETGFFGNDSNGKQWPIPNVIGVLRQ